jgi:exodeoxyribonuclease V beta subunit
MNSFYARVGRRLGPSGSNTPIEYRDVVASEGETSRERLLDAKAGEVVRQPLVLHWLAVGDEPDENAALSACAGQIVHVLSEDVGYIVHERKKDGNHMEKRRLRPADIAVLLPTNAQLKAMARKLKARGVPCVMQANASVFDGEVARELRLLLHAALHPANPRALRAAAATRTWGVSFGELRALRHDPANWDKLVDEFQRLHQLLQHRGPLAFVARLLDQRAPSLLDTVEGERWLTDLRHLGELLQEAYDTLGSGERLAGWFGQQVAGDDDEAGSDARALRLESDTGRVKLLTLHSSKGLEFPVVFLPLMWKHGSKSSKRAQLLADETGEHKGIVLGDTAKKLVKEEEYEERFRMLYVALTRAQWACHLFVVPPPAKEPKDAPLNAVCGNLVPPTKGEECAGMAWRDGWITHGGLRYAGEGRADRRTDARPLPAAPPGPLPMRHSFTTLTGHGLRSAAEEAATEDEPLDAETVEGSPAATAAAESAPGVEAALSATTFHPDLDALHGVAGPEFGNALHAIFEHRVPGAPLGEQSALVLDALRREGVRMGDDAPGLVAAVARRLQDMLDAPLGTPDGPCLGLLGTSELRAEPEFNYALDGVRLADLRAACERHGEPGLAPAREQTLAGLMNGKIDLLFMHSGRVHVLDYKSNRLGQRAKPCLEDYAPDAIDAAMRGTGYRLQALLYTVAVERYLRERLGARYRRDQHLGDCWYLFVRATGLRLPDGRACGVWRHRFSDGLLDAVQAVFGRGSRREVA